MRFAPNARRAIHENRIVVDLNKMPIHRTKEKRFQHIALKHNGIARGRAIGDEFRLVRFEDDGHRAVRRAGVRNVNATRVHRFSRLV